MKTAWQQFVEKKAEDIKEEGASERRTRELQEDLHYSLDPLNR